MYSVSERLERLPFSRFHFKLLIIGGLGLAFEALDAGIIAFILPGLGSLIGWIASVAGLVFSIIGIINVANGDEKDLPLIGGIQLVK